MDPQQAGTIRSAFAMSDPDVGSSDINNIETCFQRLQVLHQRRLSHSLHDHNRDGQARP